VYLQRNPDHRRNLIRWCPSRIPPIQKKLSKLVHNSVGKPKCIDLIHLLEMTLPRAQTPGTDTRIS